MQRYFSDKLEQGNFTLTKDDIYHIKTVMRMKNGDLIEVVFNKKLYTAKITEDKASLVKEEFQATQNFPEITLILSAIKDTKLEIVLQKATELGVSEIIITETERSIVKLDNKITKKIERWERIVKEASEQSKRLTIPKIKYKKEIDKLSGISLIADPKSDITLKKYLSLKKVCDKINILIGPEGGFSDNEINKYKKLGFDNINIGPNILRAETAPIAFVSMINYENME